MLLALSLLSCYNYFVPKAGDAMYENDRTDTKGRKEADNNLYLGRSELLAAADVVQYQYYHHCPSPPLPPHYYDGNDPFAVPFFFLFFIWRSHQVRSYFACVLIVFPPVDERQAIPRRKLRQ